MDSNNGYTIIIPAYNEIASIEKTVTDIKKLPGNYEIIVVDDGSTDGTYECVQKTGVRVFRHSVNRGYGATIKTGIQNAEFNTVVITDADSTYPNEKIPALVRVFEEENSDMVVGARIKRNVRIPLIRKPAKWFITKLASYLSGTDIPDLNSGLRVMKKSTVQKYMHLLPEGFSFTSTITLAMLTNKNLVRYVPIDYFERRGTSKIRPIYDTLNFIQLIIRMVMYFEPLRIFLPLSLSLIIPGILLTLYQAFFLRNISTAAIIILLAGIQLLAIGMLADLIDKRSS